MRVLALALCVALPCLAAFEDSAREADAARAAGRLGDAVAAYRQALAEQPEWSEGQWFLATSLYQLKRYADAADAFRALLDAKPETGAAWLLLGISEYKLGEFDEAFEHLRRGRSLGANPELTSTGAYYLALLMNRFGEHPAATQLLLPFALEGNQSPTVVEAFGLTILRKRWLPSEVPVDQHALVREAGTAAFYVGARRAEEGRAAMEQLAAKHPEDLDVRYAHGSMLVEADPATARREFEYILGRSPADYHANLVLGTMLSKQRQYGIALKHLEAARAARPESILARYQIATAKLATDEPDSARVLLEAVVTEAHEFVGAHVSLARAYYRLGRKQDGDRHNAIVRELNARRQENEPGARAAALAQPGVERP